MGPIEIDGTDAKHPCPYENGYPTLDDRYNTAHDYSVKCKFKSGVVMDVTSRGRNGVLFEGTKGRIFVSRGTIAGRPIEENWGRRQVYRRGMSSHFTKANRLRGHKQNFYRCIREGGLPVSDVYTHLQAMATWSPVGDCRKTEPHDQMGPCEGADRRRRAGSVVLCSRTPGRFRNPGTYVWRRAANNALLGFSLGSIRGKGTVTHVHSSRIVPISPRLHATRIGDCDAADGRVVGRNVVTLKSLSRHFR